MAKWYFENNSIEEYSTIKILSEIREEVFSMQSQIEMKELDSTKNIHRSLGMLSNKIMRYIHADLEDSKSIEELIKKLKDSNDHVPLFSRILTNVEAIKNNTEPINDTDEESHNQRMKEIAQELIEKVTQK